MEFYRTAEDVKMPGKYDQELFDNVKKNSKSTSLAIRAINNAQKTTNALDCILAFSQDPIRRVERLVKLLEKVTNDIAKVQAEIKVRKDKYGGSAAAGTGNVFENEKVIINECNSIIARLEGTLC